MAQMCIECQKRGYSGVNSVGSYRVEKNGLQIEEALCKRHAVDFEENGMIVEVVKGIGLPQLRAEGIRMQRSIEIYD